MRGDDAPEYWVIDLDGVMWRGPEPVPGSGDAVARILAGGAQVLFCTNNSTESGARRAGVLRDQGIPAGCEVLTSADAVATLVRPGQRCLVVGGAGLRQAIASAGAYVVAAEELAPGDRSAGRPEARTSRAAGFDAVVVGLSRTFDYAQLDLAQAAVRAGARLLASNTDSSFPGADGLHPGCGSIVAAIEVAAGRPAVSAGKPNSPMVELIRARVGPGARGVVVGDRGDTDGRLAEALGWPFGLVLSGVTHPGDLPLDVPVGAVAEDLARLVDALTGASGGAAGTHG